MNTDQSTQSTAAGATTENVLAGRLYQFAPYDGWVRLAATAEAAGESRLTVYSGVRCVLPESSISRAARVPLLPDDILCTFPIRRGEQITVKHRNTGAGANVLFWRVDVTGRR
jgi:hypothetical protein